MSLTSNKKTCTYVYVKGKKAGQTCNANCAAGRTMCFSHVVNLPPVETPSYYQDYYKVPEMLKRLHIEITELNRAFSNNVDEVSDKFLTLSNPGSNQGIDAYDEAIYLLDGLTNSIQHMSTIRDYLIKRCNKNREEWIQSNKN